MSRKHPDAQEPHLGTPVALLDRPLGLARPGWVRMPPTFAHDNTAADNTQGNRPPEPADTSPMSDKLRNSPSASVTLFPTGGSGWLSISPPKNLAGRKIFFDLIRKKCAASRTTAPSRAAPTSPAEPRPAEPRPSGSGSSVPRQARTAPSRSRLCLVAPRLRRAPFVCLRRRAQTRRAQRRRQSSRLRRAQSSRGDRRMVCTSLCAFCLCASVPSAPVPLCLLPLCLCALCPCTFVPSALWPPTPASAATNEPGPAPHPSLAQAGTRGYPAPMRPVDGPRAPGLPAER